jgi:hypothetical protein
MTKVLNLPSYRAFGLVVGSLLFLAIPQQLRALDTSGVATAQGNNIVVTVNGTPISAGDLADRQRFLAITSEVASKVKAEVGSLETQKAYHEFMAKRKPASQGEVHKLNADFLKNIQEKVIKEVATSLRDQSLAELINETLIFQAAADMAITISENDVDEQLNGIARRTSPRFTRKDVLKHLSEHHVNPATMRDKIRAQLAWRQLIKQAYGKYSGPITPNDVTERNRMLQEQFENLSEQHLKGLTDKAHIEYSDNG